MNFDPTINAGHIASATVFLVTAAIGYGTMAERVSAVDRNVASVERRFAETMAETRKNFEREQERDRESFNRIESLLRDIARDLNGKVDRPR